ncbi:MAG: glycosyltransferase family 2 protein, partial [Anaerolineales bacterium]|nr:glycosyltransferase family 2 protein [Anaerolineales bacterium]
MIIVNWNGRDYLEGCIGSLRGTGDVDFEIIVVDNESSDGSVAFLRERFPEVRVIESGGNLGFARGNNLGAQYAQGEYLAFINPDTTVEPGWLAAL